MSNDNTVGLTPEPHSDTECRWCLEGDTPKWSYDAKVWIHRLARLDRKCENPPNNYGYTIQVPDETVSTERRREVAPVTPEPHSGEMRSDLPTVSGEMDRSIAFHERACLVLIDEEQRKISPDNALIATLCDSVRLGREYAKWQRHLPMSEHSGERRSVRCIFCAFSGTLDELKLHSATCAVHPMASRIVELDALKAECDRLLARREYLEGYNNALKHDHLLHVSEIDQLEADLAASRKKLADVEQANRYSNDCFEQVKERAEAAEKRLGVEVRVRANVPMCSVPEPFCGARSAYRSAYENAWHGVPFQGNLYTRSDCARAWCGGYTAGESAVKEAIDAALAGKEPSR